MADPLLSPFVVLIDTGEQHPWTFAGLKGDSKQGYRPLVVRTERVYLGASRGDYSIDGLEGRVHVERKSVQDCQNTLLAYGQRRERWRKELEYLESVDHSAIIIEGSMTEVISTAPSWGKRTRQQNAKSLHRTIIGLQDSYAVPWFFCDSRGFAEITCYRFLNRAWEKIHHAKAKRKCRG